MSKRNQAARTLVILGSGVLFVAVVLHCLAYMKFSPGVGASNLPPALQSVARVGFLAMPWDWIVIATIALVATFGETRLRKALVLICGLAILAETALTLGFVDFFIGNELLATAGVLLLCGGIAFDTQREGPR